MRLVRLANFEQFAAVNLNSDQGAIGGPKIVPSCAQITIDWAMADGKFAHNVLTGRYTGAFAGTVAQANSILAALNSSVQFTALATHLSNQSSLSNVTIRDLNSPNGALITSTGPGAAGTSPAQSLPNEVAVVVTLHTALAGRANRGRMFIPNFATDTVAAGNVIAASAVTDLQAWSDTVQNALNASGYQLVIGQPARAAYTGSTGTQHPARPAGSQTVTSLVVRDNHFDTQRRRGLR